MKIQPERLFLTRMKTLTSAAVCCLLYGCGGDDCGLDCGSSCQARDYHISSGIYLSTNSELFFDECNSGISKIGLDGLTIQINEFGAEQSMRDPTVQLIDIDGSGLFKLGSVKIECGVGGVAGLRTIADVSACSWTSVRSATILSYGTNILYVSMTDLRSEPIGTCWMGPTPCRASYAFRLHKIGS